MLLPSDGFSWASGTPAEFTHPGSENAVTRCFCGTCGTHIITRLPGRDVVVLKVGTLDDPAHYGGPKAAIHTADKQPFHLFPEGEARFERLPPH